MELPEFKYQLDDLINAARWLEPKLRENGMHCGITGGCLFNGESDHDFDVIVYPHNESGHGEIGATDRTIDKPEMVRRLLEILPDSYELNKSAKEYYPSARYIVRWVEPSAELRFDLFIFN